MRWCLNSERPVFPKSPYSESKLSWLGMRKYEKIEMRHILTIGAIFRMFVLDYWRIAGETACRGTSTKSAKHTSVVLVLTFKLSPKNINVFSALTT